MRTSEIAPPTPRESSATASADLVVLVHGLVRTPLSMITLEWALEDAAYEVYNWGYSSFCCTIDELADRLIIDLEARAVSGQRVHLVGHSLGNLIGRALVGTDPDLISGRMVMLAPPNQGSHEADRYAHWLGWLLEPLPELTTETGSTARALPPITGIQVGIISGRYDGKVSFSESHLEGETAHIVVPALHSFIMLAPDVHRHVLTFLANGRFNAEKNDGET